MRSQFPCFRDTDCTYLDSAATTQVPDEVLRGIGDALARRGNPARSTHVMAERSHALLEEAQAKVARFIGAKPGEIAFTNNATDSVNLAVDAILQSFCEGDTLLISIAEHHSNILPYLKPIAMGARAQFIGLKDGLIDLDELQASLTARTRLVAVSHCSNVLGNINDIEAVGRIVKSFNRDILYLVDGSQAVAHLPVDVKAANADFFVFSGHKMYGPDGIGVLYVSEDIRHLIAPVRAGGGTVRDLAITFGKDYDIISPDYDTSLSILNGGTPNTSNIVGLAKAVDFLENIGWAKIREHELQLTRRLLDGLAAIEEVEIHGPRDISRKIGVVSFSLRGSDTRELAAHLASLNICIRHGAHCALPLSALMGRESLRVSIGIYNSLQEIDRLLQEIVTFVQRKKVQGRNARREALSALRIPRRSHSVSGEDGLFDLIGRLVSCPDETEFLIMGGHFLGIPSLPDNRLYPSIEGILPAGLRRFSDEFGMTSFPLYTFELAAESVRRLKARGVKAKLMIVANDATGINELRHSPANRLGKTAEQYRDELLSAFEQQRGLPEAYAAVLSATDLSPADILSCRGKYYFRETVLRSRFKKFVSHNKEFFSGVIDYVADSRSIDLDIRILSDQQLKTCSFDTFDSKTGGRFCVVTVAELLAELLGKADDVHYRYVNSRVAQPMLTAADRIVVLLSPAMCNGAINGGAELYFKLFQHGEGRRGITFLNLPLGPRARDTIASGIEATEIAAPRPALKQKSRPQANLGRLSLEEGIV